MTDNPTLGLVDTTTVPVTISVASMRQRFNGCEPDYIRDVCGGACCRSSKGGISVAVAPIEVRGLVARGAVVVDGMVQPSHSGTCPFQHAMTRLCTIHGTDDKPFGCIASPFVLTSRDTLVVRNRYRLLRCYDDGRRLPAYVAFRASLALLFGSAGADDIAARLGPSDAVNFMVPMPRRSYDMLGTIAHTRKGPR